MCGCGWHSLLRIRWAGRRRSVAGSIPPGSTRTRDNDRLARSRPALHHSTCSRSRQSGSFRDWGNRAFALGDSQLEQNRLRRVRGSGTGSFRPHSQAGGSLGGTDPGGRCHAISERTWNQNQPRIVTTEACPAGLAMIQAEQADLTLAKYRFLRYVHPTKPWMKPV